METGQDESPLLSHLMFIKMEETIDKLKALNYENLFCQRLKFRPLPKHYFAITTNSGEQFHVFTNLAVWLLNLCGCHLSQPQEFDDPNATISTIIDECKKLSIPTNFPPMKLKTGSGEQVCNILKGLVDCVLHKTHFNWQKPIYLKEDEHDEVNEEGEQELTLSKIEGEIQEDISENDDEGDTVFLDLSTIQHSTSESTAEQRLDDALESTVDPEEWQRELERVLPSLKLKIRQDNRDWRSHYEQMHQYHNDIKLVLSDTKVHLDKLHSEIAKTLEKISSREKYIKQQLESQIVAYRLKKDELAKVREKYKEGSGSVNELSQKLAEVTTELEKIKEEMNERGSSMTDAGPVVRIKQALTTLKKENQEMEVQIGLLEHSLLDIQYKTKNAIKMKMTAESNRKLTTSLF